MGAMANNCTNCGAPVKGATCEYCGSVFKQPDEVMSLGIGKTVSMRFEHNGMLYEFDLRLEQVGVHCDVNEDSIYDMCGNVVSAVCSPTYEVSLSGCMVPKKRYGSTCLYIARELSPEEMRL